jgi:hypothetical protein
MRYVFPIVGIDARGRRPGEEKLQLFENCPDHNPSREPTETDFLFESAITFEKSRFRKINASK